MNLGYWSFFYSICIGYLVFALWGTFYYKNYFIKLKYSESKDEILSLLKISWPILPSQASSSLLASADRYILKYIVSESAVGVYSIGSRFGSLIQSFFVEPFFGSYIPIAYELYVKDTIQFKELQKKYLVLITLFFTSIIIVACIPFELLFHTFINERYWDGYNLIGIVLLGYMFITIPYIITVVQTMREKLQYSMWIGIIVVLLNIGMNFLFIHLWGYNGAALVFTISYFLVMIATVYVNQKLMFIEYDWSRIIINIGIGVVTVLFQHLINSERTWSNLLLKLFLCSGGIVILYHYNKMMLNPIMLKVYRKISLIIKNKDCKLL